MGTYIFITFVPRVLISRYPPPWNHDRHRGGILKGLLLKPPALHGSGARSTTGIWKVKIQSQKSLACEWWLLWILFKIHKKTNFCFFQSEFPFVFWILEKPHFLWVKVLHFKTIYICLYNIEAKYIIKPVFQSSTIDISLLTLVYCKAVNDTINSTLRLIFMLCFCYLLPPPLPPRSRTARHG